MREKLASSRLRAALVLHVTWIVLREFAHPNRLRPAHYGARHRFTRRTPLTHHAGEVVARYRTQHPWSTVVSHRIDLGTV